MKKKKLTSLIVLVFVLLCNCDYFKSLCEPENDPKKQPTTLQNIVNNATDGEIINLEEWENVTDYTATIDKKLTIKSGNLNGASLTVKAENVKLEKMQNLSVETSSRLTIKDSKLNNLLLGGNAQSRSNTTAEINVILENCEIAEKIKINSKAKLNIAGEKTKIAKIVVAVAAEVCKILCTTEVDTKKIENVITDENGEKPEEIKITQAYKITYHSNCDELENIEDFFSPDDGTISLPTDIFKRNGYIFAGWYYDNNQAVEDSINVSGKTENIDVYAKWESTAVNKIAGIYKLLNESATIEIKNDGTFVVTVTISGDIDGYMNGNWKKANEENYEFIFDDNTAGTATSIEEDVIKMVYKNENEGMDIDSYAVKTSDENVDLSGTWIDENSIIIIKEDTFTATLKDGSSKNGNIEKIGNFFKLETFAWGAISASKQALYIDPYGKEITPSVYTKSTTNEESFEDLGGTGVYSYKLNLNDISNAWNGSQNNPNFSIVLLTDAQVKASVNKFNFSSYAYQFYSYGDMGVGNPIMPGNYAVYGKNCYENSEYKYYSGVAATVTDTTLEVFVDMSQIMKAELKFFNSDTESEANLVTENMPVDLTDYKPYVFALIDGEKDQYNYVMTNETWDADLMKMTAGATFPTDLQQSPPTTGNTNEVKELTATADTVADTIRNLSAGTYMLKVSGVTNTTITEIANAMNSNTEAKINLDLSGTTGLTEIADSAFSNCFSLTNITIPESVIKIEANAFISCTALNSVTIGNGVTSIGASAFYNCSGLTSIEIPDSVTTIDQQAFEACSNLASVTIGNNVTTIGSNAFYYCENLTSVTIPNSVTSIGASAFSGCSELTIFKVATDNQYYSSLENKKILYSKDQKTLIAYPSAEGDFTIPNSVTSIADGAFYNCSSLTNVTIPGNVTTIGYAAFSHCESLTSVTFNNTNNWYYTNNENYTGGTAINVTDPAQNAENLKDTYSGYYWYRPTELTATADTVANTIRNLSAGTYMLKVSGEITSTTITTIATAMNSNTEAKINLDLSGANGLTEIPKKSFQFCSNLISINIPKSVTIISSQSFEDSGLTSVMLPNNLQNIENHAFFKCSNLASIEIPDSVTTIGTYAFYNCSSLTSVTFKDANNWYCTSYSDFTGGQTISVTNTTENITYLTNTYSEYYWYKPTELTATADTVANTINGLSAGTYTLKVSGEITSTTITTIATAMNSNTEAKINLDLSGANGLTEIPENAFCDKATYNGCTRLLSINIPDNVTTIGDYAFSDCSSLTRITIPNSVTSIGYSAFSCCLSLTSIEIPNSVTTIGSNAFYYCENLTSVTFNNTSGWYYTNNSNFTGGEEIVVTDPAQNAENLKDTYSGYYWYKPTELTATADNVESTITGLSAGTYTLKVTGAITNDTITTIVTAMNNNTKAKINLDLSGTTELTEIANNAFLGCSSTSIIIPNSVKSIRENAFFCSDIKSITIPNNVVTINAYAFQSCSNLTNITIGNGVQSIGNSAFSRCSNLTKFEVDTDNQYYSSSDDGTILFNGDKTKLIAYPSATGDITIPDGVTSIDSYAFHHCSDLTNITIPDSVTSIGDNAFEWCSNLESITIPDSVTSIGYVAFSGCSNLTNFEVDTGNTNYSTSEDGTILFNGDKTKLIVYPSATGDITIPDGVTSIDSYAFYRCSDLTNIEIPNSVTTIGSNAFYYCEKLTSVTFKDTTSTWYYTDSENYTGGQTISVTNATENATYLKETYYDKYWYKESSTGGTTE